MAKKYTEQEMRRAANMQECGVFCDDVPAMLREAAYMMEFSNKIVNGMRFALEEVKTMQCVYSREHGGLESGNLNNVKVIIERSIKELTEWNEVK